MHDINNEINGSSTNTVSHSGHTNVVNDVHNGLLGGPQASVTHSTVVHKDIITDVKDGALPDLMVKQLLRADAGKTSDAVLMEC